ncbi:MAG: 1-(5-phosphoribosyl)-5-[(5-phosphoribosylamino)methylideneamino]imidazole-4-carboxamide isomerase [Thermoleophilaceae bacterium]|nr:1-(5-phosphoribosyl)-5-[(5-phosphoribosylamino)methylideneamino]imidazole-4-carboxamide isomerase [Thermoleophilaceae bacterium]
MILLPAVDIREGRAVNLRQGYFDEETVYADDPLEAARSFVEAGARNLHLVDLDGALAGQPVNLDHLERIAGELGVPVQHGGGLRSLEAVRAAFEAGAARVVIGTAAYTDPDLLSAALETWGERVLVGVDVRDGHVSVAAWTQATKLRAEELIERLRAQGATGFVCTNADLDGMLGGVDLEETRRISAAVGEGSLTVSGGISSLEDLHALRGLGLANLGGVISGKALYERRFTVAEAQAVLDAAGPA